MINQRLEAQPPLTEGHPAPPKEALGFAFTASNFDVQYQYFVLIHIETHPVGT